MDKIILVIVITSGIIVLFAVSFLFIIVHSNKRIIEAQNLKMAEVERERQKYKLLFEHSIAGMMRFDFSTFEVIDANATLYAMLHIRTLKELQQQILLFPAVSLQNIRDSLYFNGIIEEHEIFDKENGWFLFSAKRESNTIAHAILLNITERKEYQNKIEVQAQLLNETNDAIIVTDEQAKILYWNDAAEIMYQWQRKEIYNKDLKQKIFAPGQFDDFEGAWKETIEFGEWIGEVMNTTSDGRNILIDSHMKKIIGKEVKETFVLIVNSDITEKRQIEQYTIRTQKMESIALLSSSIAHDLQNILNPVSFSIGLIKDDISNPQNKKVLQAVERILGDGIALVKKILTFGKGITGERIVLDITALVEESLENFSGMNTKGMTVKKMIDQRHFYVIGDGQQLKQVFLNLFSNARDASADGGTLTVEITQAVSNTELSKVYTQNEIEHFVQITIRDNGIGIKEENISKIFEPFFTTKDSEYGTGIGLSIVQNIIKIHGGIITVESRYSEGTTFQIYLPISERTFS